MYYRYQIKLFILFYYFHIMKMSTVCVILAVSLYVCKMENTGTVRAIQNPPLSDDSNT